ncbi:MAG: hypothetical protein M0Q93_09485 [Terrimicrobiaceae bacterium]|nr:hypothetical protein [Terrimicrobiaceae bacterium]
MPRSLPLVSPLRAALHAGSPACSHRPVVAARAVGLPHQITVGYASVSHRLWQPKRYAI